VVNQGTNPEIFQKRLRRTTKNLSPDSRYESKFEAGTSHLQVYSVTAESTCW